MLSVNYSTQSIKATVDVKKDNDKLVATVTYSGGDGEQKKIRSPILKINQKFQMLR